MKKEFKLSQLFSITDGRLFKSIDDVYDTLNHICDANLMTHHLPIAYNYLKLKNPQWHQDIIQELNFIKEKNWKKNNFQDLVDYISIPANNKVFNIPQLKDEFDTSDFGKYMVDNSILLNK